MLGGREEGEGGQRALEEGEAERGLDEGEGKVSEGVGRALVEGEGASVGLTPGTWVASATTALITSELTDLLVRILYTLRCAPGC